MLKVQRNGSDQTAWLMLWTVVNVLTRGSNIHKMERDHVKVSGRSLQPLGYVQRMVRRGFCHKNSLTYKGVIVRRPIAVRVILPQHEGQAGQVAFPCDVIGEAIYQIRRIVESICRSKDWECETGRRHREVIALLSLMLDRMKD